MKKTWFIAGTDTDAGKTLVASGLLCAAAEHGLSTAAIKPVAAGAENGQNADAIALQNAASLDMSYAQVNPVLLQEPIAPHIAAARENKNLSLNRLVGFCRGVQSLGADLTLIEGAGGWKVPINNREYLSQLPIELNCEVILVVGLKLGCLNHALLSAQAIQADGAKLVGWIGCKVDANMLAYDENVQTLRVILPAPCLGIVPHLDEATPESAANHLKQVFA